MTDSQRETALADAFIGPESPLIRCFSTGIVALGRKLGLAIFLPPSERPAPDADTERMQELALIWLLDKRHCLNEIKAAAGLGWSLFREGFLESEDEAENYEFTLPLSIKLAATAEIIRELTLIGAADFRVAPKPSKSDPESPPGK
jgi:hypothetical protein